MKNQLKKSFSLFLAVLMLLSCWVWVAPEKAEAAGGTTTYYIKMNYNVNDNWTNAAGNYKVRVYYKTLNGTTGGTAYHEVVPGEGWCEGEGDQWIVGGADSSVSIPGFPTKVEVYAKTSTARTYGWDTGVLQVSGDGNTWTNAITGMSFSIDGNSESTTTVGTTATSVYPKLNVITAATKVEAYLNKLGGANITATPKLDAGKDQYGVSWEATFPTSGFTHSITTDSSGTTSSTVNSYLSVSGTSNAPTVTAKPGLQTLNSNAASSTYYMKSVYSSTGATCYTQMVFYHPEYTMTFDANGGKIGADSSSAVETVTMGGTDSKMYYGSVIGKSPAYRVKAGRDFMGFYSTKNDDATGLDATFSGTKFVDSETTVSTQGDMTWYAAWQATPITATFITADNQLIGTLDGRYDNNFEATNMYNGLDGVNDALKAAYDANNGTGITWSGNVPVYKDGSSTYTFSHWKIIEAYDESVVDGDTKTTLQGDVTFQAVYTKSDAATYTVSFYDGNGNVLSTQSGYKFRDDVVIPTTEPAKAADDAYTYEFIGWAKNIGKNFYVVDNENKDENGAAISYTHKDGAEFTVRGDASYVPVFRMIPREYSVTFNYTVDGGATESVTVDGYYWADGITMPEGIKDNYTAGGYRYYIDAWTVGSDTTEKQLDEIYVAGNMTLTASYGAGDPAKYTINFYDKDGNLLNADANIYEHNESVTAPEAEQIIDTDDSLFNFVAFKDKNGNTYSQTATADADYYAEYTKKDYADLHFYNYDGTLLYELDGKENSLFVGETIPAYSNYVTEEDGSTTEVLPEKAEDVVGKYNFTGWADDNGAAIVPGTDVFSGDTYLYAQFETEYKNYTVKFLNDDGTVVSEKQYHYGVEIEIPETNPTKAPDETYNYEFKAWDPDVSEVCYGDAIYTATYRRNYNYYKVTWLKDDRTTVHTATNYIYNEKIQQASIYAPASGESAGVGYEWALKEWIQCNENGEPVDADGNVVEEENAATFVRGIRMGTTPLYYYATFEKVAKKYTVNFYNADGTTLIGKANIDYDEKLDDYDDDFVDSAVKAADADYHYEFKNWVTLDEGTDIETVTGDMSVKAECTAVAHNKEIYEVVKAPTCTETGIVNKKCEADTCDLIEYDVIVDVVSDDGIPTGQVYVGENLWTYDDYTAGIDYSNVVYVGPTTNAIVNAEDTGTRSMPWNLEGELCRGVETIDYYVSEEVIADPSAIQNWSNAYSYNTVYAEALEDVLLQKGISEDDYLDLAFTDSSKKNEIDSAVKAIIASYKANVTSNIGGLNLQNGKEYIIYIRVTDRTVNGQSNKAYFSTGKIHYGSTAPTITVEGNGYGTKFCEEATFTVTDDLDGFTVTLDGEAVTLTNGKYTTTKAGVHVISVVDKNGNKSTKTFEIKGSHSYRNYSVAATCEKTGSRYDLCTLCGYKANIETLNATGHNFTTYTEKTATCVDDGYRMYTCANGCGETLQVKWNSADDVLAQAKKYDESTETWVSITADDVKHLKATGTHTYSKVKNEDGSDSDEDAWVIDKAATCVAAGSKHKDCTVCGARVTEEIAIDKTAHNFYRAKTAQQPTCTEEGWKNQTCKICGEVKEKTEMIDAIGHTAGEYAVTKEASCEEAGSKILTCSVCSEQIGEPVEDKDGVITGYDGEAVEIPALGHAYKIDGDVYSEEATDDDGATVTKWYQNYKCANCGDIDKRELESYEPPVAVTVTFDFNGGYYEVPAEGNPNELGYVPPMLKGTQKISTYAGETIAASEVKTAVKANNATKTYTFAYWATKNADGTYTEVKFPIAVTEAVTYYAVYTEKYINYSITYMNEGGVTQYKKVGYLHNGDEVALADGPAKSGDTYYTYTFAGWKLGDNIYTDKYTIDGANVILVATYTKTLKQYAVTYAYTKSNILETFLVDAGTLARDCYIEPEKEKESGGHYVFTGWNKAEQLKSVESNIYTTPTFRLTDHTYETSHVADATCTSNALKKNTCTECGYFYEFEVEGTILNHEWVISEANGKYVKTCSRCGESTSQDVTYTIDYYKDGKVYTHSYNVVWGTVLSTVLPATPTKAQDEYYTYTFKGWALKDDTTETVIDTGEIKVEGNMALVAIFNKTLRTYTVTFAYDAYNVIKVYKNVAAGSDVVYDGPTPVKANDDSYHYIFEKWSATTEDILKDTYVKAEFKNIKHENTPNVTAATCTTGQGTNYTCSCGWSSGVTETAKPLGHSLVEKAGTRVEATEGEDGYVILECTRAGCDYEERKTLTWEDPTVGLVKITVTVKDDDGNPINAATVALYQDSNWVVQDITNAKGVATFMVAPGKYTVIITGVKNADDQQTEINVDSNGNYNESIPQMNIRDCGCACHRENLWGTIFRFFHKIIKMLTGEFKCCKDPSDLY